MEPQEPMTQPVMQQPQPKGKGVCVLVSAIIAVLLAGAAAGGMYYYMDQQAKDTKATTDSQIQGLQQEVADLKEAANWQTYTNSTYGFSFKYPTGWTVAEKAASYGDAREYEISFDDEGYYVTVFGMGDQTADAFVSSYYGGVEAGPSDIEDVTINDNAVVKFFMQQPSVSDETVGGTNYFFSKNETGVDISNSMKAKGADDATLTGIVDSFTFN
ncbi:MAG: hypothetical protein PVI21_02185 [Candidatus Woesebacteria bacterium]|jgi:hypothetical protein